MSALIVLELLPIGREWFMFGGGFELSRVELGAWWSVLVKIDWLSGGWTAGLSRSGGSSILVSHSSASRRALR